MLYRASDRQRPLAPPAPGGFWISNLAATLSSSPLWRRSSSTTFRLAMPTQFAGKWVDSRAKAILAGVFRQSLGATPRKLRARPRRNKAASGIARILEESLQIRGADEP
jgi:hypothetical protein